KRRPIAVLTILLTAVALGTMTHLGQHTPWSPVMDAWSSEPIPSQYVHGRTALERQGALVFQAKQCHNCHSLDDRGGKRGPALDSVAVRLNEDQLIRQVLEGGGNMPAYGKTLRPAETTALVVFLVFVYSRGWFRLRSASPISFPPWRLAAFVGGLFALWIALGSPLAALDHQLLTIHMMKHLLLMAVGAPLILLGAPALPLLCG